MLPSADTVEVCLCFYKANSDLAVIWAVGQKMWQRDFPGTYENLKKDWCDSLRPIMDAILGIIFFFWFEMHNVNPSSIISLHCSDS